MRAQTVVLATALTFGAQSALACACCPNPGERSQYTFDFTGIYTDDFGELQTANGAQLYWTDCGQDCITGLASLRDHYTADFALEDGLWSLTLDAGHSTQATLTAPVPTNAERFATDTRPGDQSGLGFVYSEIRLDMTITGTGPGWSGPATPITAELILMGYGTACADVRRSAHWMLTLGQDTDDVSLRLFGRFQHPDS